MPQGYGVNANGQIYPPKKSPCKSPCETVAAQCQRTLDRANEEISLYQGHVAKLTEILKNKDCQISTLTGDNEKLSGQIDKHRRKLDDLFDAEELLAIERLHNEKLQAEIQENEKKIGETKKKMAQEIQKQRRWMEDVQRLTISKAKLEHENDAYLQRLRATEQDVEATRNELELINEIVNGIDPGILNDNVDVRSSQSALTLLSRMKQHRNDAVTQLKSTVAEMKTPDSSNTS